MVISPTSPTASPFADPPQAPAQALRRTSTQSEASPLDSPPEGYGYVGPAWRGGAGGTPVTPRGGEKWWHALCAWGGDHDEGDGDGQEGRTNPFE
jgi:hypothetical protein